MSIATVPLAIALCDANLFPEATEVQTIAAYGVDFCCSKSAAEELCTVRLAQFSPRRDPAAEELGREMTLNVDVRRGNPAHIVLHVRGKKYALLRLVHLPYPLRCSVRGGTRLVLALRKVEGHTPLQ